MGSEVSHKQAQLSQATIAVHGGERSKEQPFGAVVSPVFHPATSSFQSFDEMRRYARGELPEAYAHEKSRVFWFETPTNPINRVVDLDQAARASQKANVFSIVDTFATPILQKPIAHGIDGVMHSATKYLGGHSDLTAGAVAGTKDFIDRVRQVSVSVGATLDPAAAYLLSRGIRTLDLRVRSTSQNALALVQAFSRHPKVAQVYYPGLEDDPGHDVAKRQMTAYGGIVAFDLVGGETEVEKLFDSFKLIRPAPSLGGVETLVSYPLYSSHVGFSAKQLAATGVSAATVRCAVGIEAAEDIIADITQALDNI